MLSSALTKSSLLCAEMDRLGMMMSSMFCHCGSLGSTMDWLTANCAPCIDLSSEARLYSISRSFASASWGTQERG